MKKRLFLAALLLSALAALAGSAVADGDPPPNCIPGQICNP